MDQWEKNYYITSLAGASNGSALVVMSKGKQNKLWLQNLARFFMILCIYLEFKVLYFVLMVYV